ncbi:IS1 family transposase [Escherichia coli]
MFTPNMIYSTKPVTVNLHCPRYQSVQVYRHRQNSKGLA